MRYSAAAEPFFILLGPALGLLFVIGWGLWRWKRNAWLVALGVAVIAVVVNALSLVVLFDVPARI